VLDVFGRQPDSDRHESRGLFARGGNARERKLHLRVHRKCDDGQDCIQRHGTLGTLDSGFYFQQRVRRNDIPGRNADGRTDVQLVWSARNSLELISSDILNLSDNLMHIPVNAPLWGLFMAGHALHVLKRAGLSKASKISGVTSRREWFEVNALTLLIRLFANAAAFSYWLAHPDVATHLAGGLGIPMDLTLEPGHATAAMFGLSGDSMVDWVTAKVPFLQKEIPSVSTR
jgi:hypothetical protein